MSHLIIESGAEGFVNNLSQIRFLSLGRKDYDQVFSEQLRLRALRQQKEIPDTILTVEHPRVITQGRRPSGQDFITPPEELRQQGFQVVEANRGGRLTYHGPGQLVAYFILSLKARRLTVPSFVHQVEETALQTLICFGIQGQRHSDYPGVWVEDRKIVSIGLAVDRGVSMHGLALNVNPDLGDFRFIVPCGIQDCKMTSIFNETGRDLSLREVESTFKTVARRVWTDGDQKKIS